MTTENLQRRLEKYLRAQMAGRGSPLYALTWKHWDMPSGPPILALRASGRRISGSGSGGWPTPDSSMIETADPERILERRATCKEKHQNGNGFGLNLANAAVVYPTQGWPTPIVNDELGSTHCYSGKNPDGTHKIALKLPGAVKLAEGWATPQASDNVEGRRTDLDSPQKCLGRDVKLLPEGWATPRANDGTGAKIPPGREGGMALKSQVTLGETPNGSPAPTEKRGQLNPAFSLWLMGFPSVWGCYAPSKARK